MASHVRAPLSLVSSPNRRETSDAELALALGAGEPWAVSEVWRRFAPMVLVMAERTLGSRADAEDIGQEVFYRVCALAASLRDPKSLRSFVYSVAIRVLKTALRYRRLRRWLSFHRPEALADLRHFTLDIEARDSLMKFYALLDRLSARDRLVFVLRRVESMTVDEIAKVMELSESTVKRSLLKTSERLSKWARQEPLFADLEERGLGRLT
ncbi:MAG: sigma-70 family RNA polymerase sigma factor [Myxococcales bacterium]|nr:MAG: sigma-70 family RNA polymerase sigma factor [Myxococcales bacterium]